MQALPDAPESLCIVEMGAPDTTREDAEGGSVTGMFLNIGLQVGRFTMSHSFGAKQRAAIFFLIFTGIILLPPRKP
jgi:hypothetical protein